MRDQAEADADYKMKAKKAKIKAKKMNVVNEFLGLDPTQLPNIPKILPAPNYKD